MKSLSTIEQAFNEVAGIREAVEQLDFDYARQLEVSLHSDFVTMVANRIPEIENMLIMGQEPARTELNLLGKIAAIVDGTSKIKFPR